MSEKTFDLITFYASGSTSSEATLNSIYDSHFDPYYGWFRDWLYPNPIINYPTITYYYGYEQSKPSFPPANICQDKAGRFMEIKMAISGFKKEDIEIETRDNYLLVSGKMKKEEPYKRDDVIWIKENLKSEEFSRKFKFPDNLFDFRNPKVTYVDGMLTIWIKRNPELSAKDKKIAIE